MSAHSPDLLGDQERAFTACLRDEAARLPDGVASARMQLYRTLTYRNIDASLTACFPVLHSILGKDAWSTLVAEFIARHRCVTPIYRRLPAEFVAYLNAECDVPGHLPFMRELAHYEWIELDLMLDPADPSLVDIDIDGDLLDGTPVVSPLARVLDYAFPVHRLSADYAPHIPPSARTQIVVYRDGRDEIGFLEINPLTHDLLTLLATGPAMNGRAALARIAEIRAHIDPQLIASGGAVILAELRERSVILGARRARRSG